MVEHVFSTFSDFSDFITDTTSAPIFNSFFTFSGNSISNQRFQAKNYESIYGQGVPGNPCPIRWYPGEYTSNFGYTNSQIGYKEIVTADGANFVEINNKSDSGSSAGVWYFIWNDDFLVVLGRTRAQVNGYFPVFQVICFNNDYFGTADSYVATSNLASPLDYYLIGNYINTDDLSLISNDRQRSINGSSITNFVAQPIVSFSQNLPVYKIFRDMNDLGLTPNTEYTLGDSKFYTLIGFLGIKTE